MVAQSGMTGRTQTLRFAWQGLLASALGVLCTPSQALVFETSHTAERLGANREPWQQTDISARTFITDTVEVGAFARQAQRFGGSSSEAGLTGSVRLPQRWTLAGMASTGNGAGFLPRVSASFDIARAMPDGWVLGGGWLRRLYATTGTSAFSATVDKYAGPWRVSVTAVHARSGVGTIGTVWRGRVDHEWSSRLSLGVSAARGSELDVAVASLPIQTVTAYAVSMRVPLDGAWFLVGEALTHRQGTAYTRTGGRFGIEYRR